jgi:hypothetical protein
LQDKKCKKFNVFLNQNDTCSHLFTLVMKFHDRQSSERCIRKLISRHCLDKTHTRWNDFLFLITDDRYFRPQTFTNGLVFRECKHIKNIFEDVYFTKNSFHITLTNSQLNIDIICWPCFCYLYSLCCHLHIILKLFSFGFFVLFIFVLLSGNIDIKRGRLIIPFQRSRCIKTTGTYFFFLFRSCCKLYLTWDNHVHVILRNSGVWNLCCTTSRHLFSTGENLGPF